MESIKQFFKNFADVLDFMFPIVARGILFSVLLFLVITPFFGLEVEISNNGVVIVLLFAIWIETDAIKRARKPSVEITLQCEREECCDAQREKE